MKRTEKLFVYGLLKPQYFEPKVVQEAEPGVVSGLLYDLGKDAAAVEIGDDRGKILGYVLTVTEKTLIHIDEMEHPQFERVLTRTRNGMLVWIYEYLKPIPKSAVLVQDWHEHKRKKK